jgi:hypothetical protein
MNVARKRRYTLVPLVIAVVAASLALALVAATARAGDGGMSSMPGMSAEEMQNMATPTPAPSVTAMSGDVAPAMDPNMDMGGGSANWIVVGGFVAVIAGATLAAAATKRHLRRRVLAGELVGAGIQDV